MKMPMDHTMFEKLKPEVDALRSLLENPEPPSYSWTLEVLRRWEAIVKLWTDNPDAHTSERT